LFVFLQGMLLLPLGVGMLVDLPDYPWLVGTISVVVCLTILFFLVRNVARLWRLPAASVSLRSSAFTALLGAWFALVASGPLIEGSARAKPLGVCSALLALSLLALAGRDIFRVRRGGSESPIAPPPVDLPVHSS
jgi:hypothetical protein